MKFGLFLLTIVIISLGCSRKNKNIDRNNIEGQYVGTFERNGNASNVNLNLSNNEFSGNSNVDRFPAICSGEYTISNDTIIFENACVWDADFDWSLILYGNWHYTYENNTLTMTKNADKYILTKQ